MMLEWIRTVRPDEPVVAIATKTDKLNKTERENNLNMLWEKLELTEDDILVPFSTKDDEGKNTVWDMINLLLYGAEE